MSDRRKIAIGAGLALAIIAVRHPTADIRLITHDAADPTPHRMQAAIDFGLVGVSVLYTWTQRLR
ncbi:MULTISPECIES: hypothetical protein [unclassified Sphingomonas]|jgi:hypothetical protein|uniref:hypothetical protein n=1 Tax=unclassified Sphingomonas TaxID=196159 RepID=UPI000E10090E|nr:MULTISPECIES: hypothetical protein [unclassified Sphingomonas]AXJ95645.1 hypothetical protein DM480_09095 [Sphingomonas sp. FARSPH]